MFGLLSCSWKLGETVSFRNREVDSITWNGLTRKTKAVATGGCITFLECTFIDGHQQRKLCFSLVDTPLHIVALKNKMQIKVQKKKTGH